VNSTVSTSTDPSAKKFLDAKECGTRYGCSWRHWLRLCDAGKAPRPVRLGRLVRWAISDLESWEAEGCTAVRNVKGASR
jgi:predicted DNA-binding transcriptional regulator AlpA